MIKYQSLEIYKYTHPGMSVREEYERRYNSPYTIHTNLKINPMKGNVRSNKTFKLFIAPSIELQQEQEIISQKSKIISNLISELPGIAKEQLIFNTLLSEIKSTNDIEGVQTTNDEVNEAIVSAQSDDNEGKRLDSFAKMYFNIIDQKFENINTLEDIRMIYDFLLRGEISEDKLPDGHLFRNKFVRIGTDVKTVHEPLANENDFVSDLKNWIDFMKDNKIPFLLKAFIAHYFFEYVHPFNDGNGRLGRYIICVYLGNKLDPLSAITFSNQINKGKGKYYKAFEKAGNIKNYGEMTFFVLTMMKIFSEGQSALINDLKEKKAKLNYFKNCLDNLSEDKDTKLILYLYIQSYLFNDFGNGIEDRIIRDVLKEFGDTPNKIYWTTAQKIIRKLTDANILITVKKSPITRIISQSFIEDIQPD